MTSTLPPLIQACSGAIGSASANALTYPLDLVTTRLQLDSPATAKRTTGIPRAIRIIRHIIQKHGLQALYDGILTDTGATLLSNFLYFYLYSFLRSLLTRGRLLPASKLTKGAPSHKPNMLEELLLGFLAGVASRAISTPLNIVTLQLQAESDNDEDDGDALEESSSGVGAVVKRIYKERGLVGFWRGFETTTLLSLNPSLTLTFFQLYRRLLSRTRPAQASPTSNPRPGEAFIGAAVSNSIAVTLLYPLILAKTRLQASSAVSMREALIDAYKGSWTRGSSRRKVATLEDSPGLPGLYQGLQMQIVKGFLSQGVTFLVKGRIEQMVVAFYLRRK